MYAVTMTHDPDDKSMCILVFVRESKTTDQNAEQHMKVVWTYNPRL